MATETRQFESDERLFVRVPFATEVKYSDDTGHAGGALSDDISRGGLSLRMGRYLRPGRFVLLTLDTPGEGGVTELKTRVAWCRPDKSDHRFRAGLRIFHDEPDTMDQMSRLMYEAVMQHTNGAHAAIAAKSTWWALPTRCANVTRSVIAASLGVTFGIVSYLTTSIA